MKRTNGNSYLVIIDGILSPINEMLKDYIVEDNRNNVIYCEGKDDYELYENVKCMHSKYPNKWIVIITNTVTDNYIINLKDDFEDLFNGKIIQLNVIIDSYNDFDNITKQLNISNNVTMQSFIVSKNIFENYKNAKVISMNSKETGLDLYNRAKIYLESVF